MRLGYAQILKLRHQVVVLKNVCDRPDSDAIKRRRSTVVLQNESIANPATSEECKAPPGVLGIAECPDLDIDDGFITCWRGRFSLLWLFLYRFAGDCWASRRLIKAYCRHLNQACACPDHIQFSCCRIRQVNNPVINERTAVVHADDHASVVAKISDANISR